MKLREGTLYPGTETPAGDGVNQATRAIIRVEGEMRSAFIKRIPLNGVLAECFCGLVMRQWGLPVPEPVLVREGDAWVFASLDEGYPSLKKHITWDENYPDTVKSILIAAASSIICNWDDAPKAMAVDELLSNEDRNIGNFLWDGASHAYIDHERTMGCVPHTTNLMAKYAEWSKKSGDCQNGAVGSALLLKCRIPDDCTVFGGIAEDVKHTSLSWPA